MLAWKSSSSSCGVTCPMALCSRSGLCRLTHLRVSRSIGRMDFHGPRTLMTPVLTNPMMLSASALP